MNLWDLSAGGGTPYVLTGHIGTITDLTFGTSARLLFTTSTDETVRAWNVETREAIHEFAPHSGTIYAVTLSGDGTRILTGGDDKTAVEVANLADPEKARAVFCSTNRRRALDKDEVRRLVNRIDSVDMFLRPLFPIVTAQQLKRPIDCPSE